MKEYHKALDSYKMVGAARTSCYYSPEEFWQLLDVLQSAKAGTLWGTNSTAWKTLLPTTVPFVYPLFCAHPGFEGGGKQWSLP